MSWIASTVLLAGFALAASSDGAQTVKAKKKSTTQAPTGSVTHEIIAELKSAHKYLEMANHDYKGHRAKASHDIMQAIHELEKHHHHHHKHALKTAAVPYPHPQHHHHLNGHTEPQAQSDAQVKIAGEILKRVHSQVSGLPHNNHSAKAVKHVHEASVQVHEALAASPLVAKKD
jgi:hypothetical protein